MSRNLMLSARGMMGVAAAAVALAAIRLSAAEPVAAVTYSPHAAEPSCHMNMGPTGAAAWMRGDHFVVVSIQQQSPAYGRLMLGDVVIGVGDQPFGPDGDSRIALGHAIGQAEATGESLKVTVLRNGVQHEVAIDLPRMGGYAPTWPVDCEKSRQILDHACRSLVDSQMPEGHQLTDGAFGTFTSGLLFLASGEARYLDPARRAAYAAAGLDYANFSYNNWAMGYGGLLMAEYFLATGDDSVLPTLAQVAQMIADGQMICGSWGHNSPAAGYGALNQTGLACAMTLVLARECGVTVDETALEHALTFFGRYAETGSVPYGDHRPGGSLDDNGKNAMAAVLFHLAGRDDEARAFAASAAESYWLREEGHTGGLFSIIWGPLGASLAGDARRQTFLDYQTWYYDLARQWTGGITMLPYKEALTRFDNNSYIEAGGDFTTGGIALAFALPRRKLRILGAPPSVFAATLPDELHKARDRYLARDWPACDAALAAIDPDHLASDEQRRWLAQLVAARRLTVASTDRVLAEIACNLQDGAAYRALQQLEALKRCIGDAGDPRLADLEARFAESTTAWHVREGRTFYERWDKMFGYTVVTWVPQGRHAKRLLENVPSPRLPFWEPLSPTSDVQPQRWRTRLLAADDTLDAGWAQPEFDDSGWRSSEGIVTRFTPGAEPPAPAGPIAARRRFTIDDTHGVALRVRLQTVRNALTRVYLNGTLIVDVERGQRGGYAAIQLDPAAVGLLRQGENVLAVTATEQGQAANHLDVGLDISRTDQRRRHLPIERVTHLYAAALPDVDTSLRVDATTRRFREALRQSYLDMPVDALLEQLRTTVAYHRGLAEDALVAKGMAGIEPAIALHDDPDWKVRAAALSVMQKAWKSLAAADDQSGLALLAAQVPVLTRRVSDDHYWVRVQACTALGELGDKARDAVPALLTATDDPQEWVRQSAVTALQKIGAEDDAMLTAIRQATQRRNSSFGIPQNAVAFVRQSATSETDKLQILVEILQNPPEGGGGRLLAEIIDLACAMDPDGEVMIPVLIDAATDRTHLSRQRGNPRGKAIEALGGYGGKASAAIATLKAILADESERATQQHEAARAALQAIGG